MPLIENTILENRYRIEGLLSQGGMGAIYRAFDTNLKTPVAIKENFFQTAHSIQQFEQEALILARLRHPSLPRVIHHFSFQQKQYLVMDFIEGENLWNLVQKQGQPLEERRALVYLLQVCKAVSYLHRQSPPIIHRDIKPQNIKITPQDQAVLVDFGIAKVVEIDSRTHTGAQAFTPGFSPPEQYSGAGTTLQSDVYALGATLYAVLIGKKPPDSISRMTGGANYQAPHLINPNLSRAVSEAIEHAMQVQLARRATSVEAWQKSLEAVLAKTAVFPPSVTEETSIEPTLASATPVEAVVLGGEPEVVASLPLPAQGEEKSRSLWLWLGVGAVVMILIAGLINFAARRPGTLPPAVDAGATVAAALTIAAQEAVARVESAQKVNTEATVNAVLTAAAHQKAAEAATRQARATPTATLTPLPPPATHTATSPPSTATATPSPTVALPSITVETDANLRSGPGTTYEQVGELANGSTVEIIGRNEDGNWWQVSYPDVPAGVAWLAADLGTATQGAAVAVATAPPPPTSAAPAPQAQIERILSPTMFEFLNITNCLAINEAVVDPANDISSAQTDIVQVSSSLTGETLTVSFILRELPELLTFHRPGVDNFIAEYEWAVRIDVDADQTTGILSRGIDYNLSAGAIVFDTTTPPHDLPIIEGVEAKLSKCENSGACNSVDATITVEPEANRLTLTGVIPGITSESRLGFETTDYFAGFDFAVCPAN